MGSIVANDMAGSWACRVVSADDMTRDAGGLDSQGGGVQPRKAPNMATSSA